jgi:predicted HicB family RNase H-like nuclease
MELHVTGELEAKLTHSAAQRGSSLDEVVHDVLTRYFEEEERFVEAVTRG